MILSLYLAGLFIFIFADKNVVRFNFSILLPIEYEYNHAICYFDPVVKISINLLRVCQVGDSLELTPLQAGPSS